MTSQPRVTGLCHRSRSSEADPAPSAWEAVCPGQHCDQRQDRGDPAQDQPREISREAGAGRRSDRRTRQRIVTQSGAMTASARRAVTQRKRSPPISRLSACWIASPAAVSCVASSASVV